MSNKQRKNSGSPRRASQRSSRSGGSAGSRREINEAVREASQPDADEAAMLEGIDIAAARASAHAADTPTVDEQNKVLLNALTELRQKRAIYEACAKSARERAADLDEKQARLADQLSALQEERDAIARAKDANSARASKLDDIARRLEERENAATAREAAADAGFPERRAAAIATLEAELRENREDHAQTLAIQRADLDAERADFRSRVLSLRGALDQERQELEEAQAALASEQGEVRRERVALAQRERDLDREVRAQAAATIERLNIDLAQEKAIAAAASESVTWLNQELAEVKSRWSAVGDEDPRDIMTKLRRAQDEIGELRDKLSARLDDDTLDRLRWLEEQNRNLNEERERLRYDLQAERGRQLADGISALQVKQLADAQEEFAIISRGYHARIATLKETLKELTDDRADPTAPVFPACTRLDDDAFLQEPGRLDDEVPDLYRLALDLQGAMWKQSKRAYDLDDVCGVLGGMAMSHLHILEGPSGIGKTSLPRALATALGTACKVIEVQAGWRDRFDLFGHYNAFEHRFQEEDFLLALYTAQTPRYRDRPYFIVLDEMNLSRPEQYFSVLLSRLEAKSDEPIRLAPVRGGHTLKHLDSTGTGIAIPPNVWFVGTANRDESTLELADKTYSRSYVLELPTKRPHVPGDGKTSPYSVHALKKAFEHAAKEHRSLTAHVMNAVEELKDDLYDVARIHVDPRVTAQLRDYVPVVVAARGANKDTNGGEFFPAALAADQFISSKFLQRLHTRYDITHDGISRLEKSIIASWPTWFPGTEPTRCMRVIADEKRRLNA